MAYPNYARPGRIRQGGVSWFQLFLQQAIGTPVTAAQLASRPAIEKVTRLFTSHDLDVAGENLESEAVAGGIDRQEGQPGQRWFEGPVSTELYRASMLTYIQAGLAANRATASEAITDVQVITTGTPEDAAVTATDKEFMLTKSSTSGTNIQIQKQPTEDGAGLVSTPKQLQVKLAVGNSKMVPEGYWVKLKGVRKTGLGPYDVEAVEQQIDFTGAAAAAKTSTIDADDYYFSQVTAIEFKEPIGDTNSPETIELEILAKTPQKRTAFEDTPNPFDGWTYLGSQAGGPLLGFDVVPTEMAFNIGARMSLDMTLRSGLGWRNRTLVGGFLEKRTSFHLDATKYTEADKRDRSHPEYDVEGDTVKGYPFIDRKFFPGYGGVVVLDAPDGNIDGGQAIIFNDMTLAINQGLDFLEGTRGSPSRLSLERDAEGRTIDCNFTSYYEDPDASPYTNTSNAPTYVDWTERFFAGQSTKVEVYAFYWDRKGKQTHHKITLRKCNVGEVTRRSIADKGRVSQSVPLQVLRKGTESLVEWEVVDDAGWENPTYA